jgi:hypothetical protein
MSLTRNPQATYNLERRFWGRMMMFSGYRRRSFGGRLRRAVVWAMAPLALLNGRPVVGCICADGHFDPACRALGSSGIRQSAHGASSIASRVCSRCGTTAVPEMDRRSAGQTDCCQRHDGQHRTDGGRVRPRPCCTPVVQFHTAPAIVGPTATGDDRPAPALTLDAQLRPPAAPPRNVIHRAERSADPPPDDLVIALRRLVI